MTTGHVMVMDERTEKRQGEDRATQLLIWETLSLTISKRFPRAVSNVSKMYLGILGGFVSTGTMRPESYSITSNDLSYRLQEKNEENYIKRQQKS